MTIATDVNSLASPAIMVVGDAMIDRYIYGDVERISPEAPVIILSEAETEDRLGGSANVAHAIHALGGRPSLATVIGNDPEAGQFHSLLSMHALCDGLLVKDPLRHTTLKQRFVGRTGERRAQMLRIDRETKAALSPSVEQRLLAQITQNIPNADLVLVSDYAKGVCSIALMKGLIDRCNSLEIPILVDPRKDFCSSLYFAATGITPNRIEAEKAVGFSISSPSLAFDAAKILLKEMSLKFVVIKLDRDGMILATDDGCEQHVDATRRDAHDVTGAGDIVLATLGVGLGSGLPIENAMRLANFAAGLKVERFGTAVITLEELRCRASEREESSVTATT